MGPRWCGPNFALGVLLGPAPRRHFPANSCFSTKENKFGVDFQLRRPPAKHQGKRSQRQPRPTLAYGDPRARGEKGKRCFAEQRRIGDVVCSPTRVYLSRMQLLEWILEQSIRSGLGAEVSSWIWGDCTGPGPEGIFLPPPASPRSRTRLEWLFSSGDHQQSSRAKEARGSPNALWPMESRELGEKKASVAFVRKGALGLWFVPRGESTLPECSSLHGVWSGA